jgi:SAM-dependent methyltransferase
MNKTGAQLGLSFFKDELFYEFHSRIYESDKWKVFINKQNDFAVIYPKPEVDYSTYLSRSQKLGIKDPKLQSIYLNSRIDKIKLFLRENNLDPASILEIGANDGTFLKLLSNEFSGVQFCGVEPSAPHRKLAQEKNLTIYKRIEDCRQGSFDVICMFHTFEHFTDPIAILQSMHKFLSKKGIFIIEIPSFSDPLLSVYKIAAFKDFYFQAQHPFIYSSSSLSRLLGIGYCQIKIVPFQRYGLANHMHWLKNNKPGVLPFIAEHFISADTKYRKKLEELGKTDTIFTCFWPKK